jgi:hypothetical protein
MNSAPDFDVASLGEAHFAWVVDAMADLVIALARTHAQSDASAAQASGLSSPSRLRWDAMLGA